MRFLHFLVALLCSVAVSLSAVNPGEAAPAITLPSAAGETVNLSDFKGKTVVLEWINFGCPFVKKFYSGGDMQKYQADAKADDIVWLSINSSAEGKQGNYSAADLGPVLKDHKWAGTAYLLDTDGAVGKAYGAKTTPHMYIVQVDDAGKGTVVYAGGIDSKKSVKAADIASAEPYVINALTEIKAGKAVSNASTQPYGCSVKYAN